MIDGAGYAQRYLSGGTNRYRLIDASKAAARPAVRSVLKQAFKQGFQQRSDVELNMVDG
jgi:hypothetical protein